ncbi:S8 family serine peptidase [Curtobacterium sp. ISL-83]|uniref:S8 family peptidase n=1 Tax=Curtobacterium sp. ISL-83 TaxID=2819145 RepID=UPI001BEA3332|nr:S8 family serine peptidase [Curtobacterium sp. ISL-83]MBT2501354.1 S8 family serine peptidase [Curtobacterium sp. ISL-83]
MQHRSHPPHRRPLAAAVAAAVGALCLTPLFASAAVATPTGRSGLHLEDGDRMNYVVNTAAGAGAVDTATRAVEAAGGSVLSTYPEIGVVTAQSDRAAFLARIRDSIGVQSAGPTRTSPLLAMRRNAPRSSAETAAELPADPGQTGSWGNDAIGASAARSIERGSKDVVVGIIDSGIDVTHRDLAGQVDPSLSVGCSADGLPDQSPAAWGPEEVGTPWHGTAVAGVVAAADNGTGIVGVAPGVTLASVRIDQYAESSLCAYMWAARHGFEVAQASYWVYPWHFWCDGDPDQAPVAEALRRAMDHADREDVVMVAAAGNESYDLAHKTVDNLSPVDGPREFRRDVSEGCRSYPVEHDAVVTVSALRNAAGYPRAIFSNHGEGSIDIGGPGQQTASDVIGGWALVDGTSFAAPHVSGVAALLRSVHPEASAAEVRAMLRDQAIDLGTPADSGAGLVNAFAAVAEDRERGAVAGAPELVRAGKDFTVLGVNYSPGETVTLEGEGLLAPRTTADERGRVRIDGRFTAATPASTRTLTVHGAQSGQQDVEIEVVGATIDAPTVTSPRPDTTLGRHDGVLRITGTGTAERELSFTISPVRDGARTHRIPGPVARSGDENAFETEWHTGFGGYALGSGWLLQDGAWHVDVSGVPDGTYELQTELRHVDGTSASASPVRFTVGDDPEPPVVDPGDGSGPGDGDGTDPGNGDGDGTDPGNDDGTDPGNDTEPPGVGGDADAGITDQGTADDEAAGTAHQGALAFTGAEVVPIASAALVLLTIGGLSMVLVRRRARRAQD